MNEPPRIRPLLVLVLLLAGCGILGLDGPTLELRILDEAEGPFPEDSASLTGIDPVQVQGLIVIASRCDGTVADVRETNSRIVLTIAYEDRDAGTCPSIAAPREYRATIRRLNPGTRTLYVIHDGGWANEKPDTVLVDDVSIPEQ